MEKTNETDPSFHFNMAIRDLHLVALYRQSRSVSLLLLSYFLNRYMYIMNRDGSREEHFAALYNDVEKYPTLQDIAEALGRSRKTVKNIAGVMRGRKIAGEDIPDLISRAALIGRAAVDKALKEKIAPGVHADNRARNLSAAVRGMLSATGYPITNPEAVVVDSHVSVKYDRVSGYTIESEGAPRTWLSDTLRVAPVLDSRNKTFIFSGAQNDTPVDPAFWNNLNAYANSIDAQIVIGPWTYETNWWSENNPASRRYDAAIWQNLCFGQMRIGESFAFCGEMNTLPTATRPVSDLTSYARGSWMVVPHATVQLVSVPAINPRDQAFQVMSTGSVTRPRVIPRKSGVKSIDRHRLGAVIVEFDETGAIFCRQLLANPTGGFQDLDVRVEHGVVTTGNRVRAVTAADIHSAKLQRRNSIATFGYDPKTGAKTNISLIDLLRPEYLMLHDIHDQESRNHHNEDDVSADFEMAHRGRESVQEEIQRAVDFIAGIKRDDMQVIVVDSNHDIALERYVREGRYRMDGQNFRFGLTMDAAYHDARAQQVNAVDNELPVPKFSLLEWAMRHVDEKAMRGVDWVYDGGSLLIDGVQVGWHGFRGVNGAKGTVAGYARLGHPISIGDKHSPSIMDEVYGAGVMQLEHGYNKGPSGWAVSHVVQYDHGLRALITLQNGKCRAKA
jgi:hypothetical protein